MRGVLIAASLVLASPTFAQQVRVINGDIEHVYGYGGELLDDADLQARNHAPGSTCRLNISSRFSGGNSISRKSA